jgi:hypothetical protein
MTTSKEDRTMMRIEPTALAMVVLGFAWPAFAQTEKNRQDQTGPSP